MDDTANVYILIGMVALGLGFLWLLTRSLDMEHRMDRIEERLQELATARDIEKMEQRMTASLAPRVADTAVQAALQLLAAQANAHGVLPRDARNAAEQIKAAVNFAGAQITGNVDLGNVAGRDQTTKE